MLNDGGSTAVWREVPVGLDAARWATRDCRSVLVVVHTVVAGQRLTDVIRLFEADLRVKLVFTTGPDVLSAGVGEFLSRLGAAVIPWRQATALTWDLVLAASYEGLHRIHGPAVFLPHGAGYIKLIQPGNGAGPTTDRPVYGLDPHSLVRDGAVVPAALVLPHRDHLADLEASCPQALPVAVVAGDPTFDRLVASCGHRPVYRAALDVAWNQRLVVLASTWSRSSLFGHHLPGLVNRVLDELPPDRYRVAMLVHPHVWYSYGAWQVRAWLAAQRRRGLTVVPPDVDWRAVLTAADWIIGDHGSVTVYGAVNASVTGASVLLAGFPHRDIHPTSPAAVLAEVAPRIRTRPSLVTQLERAAAEHTPDRYAPVLARVTSESGRAARLLRRLFYRLLKLPQPTTAPTTDPVMLDVLAA